MANHMKTVFVVSFALRRKKESKHEGNYAWHNHDVTLSGRDVPAVVIVEETLLILVNQKKCAQFN